MVRNKKYSNSVKSGKSDVIFDYINMFLLVLILITILYPLIYIISASISAPINILHQEIYFLPKNVTLESYQRVFSNPDVLNGYKNTIIYTTVGTLLNLLLTIMGAYPLSRKNLFGRNLIMKLLVFTMFFSGGIITRYLVIKQLGLINTIGALIFPEAIIMFNLIIMKTYFENAIPAEIQEAAFIDGCSNIKTLFRIILPLSKPIIAVVILFYAVKHWNSFFEALLYLTDEKKYPLQLVLRQIFQSEVQSDMMAEVEEFQQVLAKGEGIKYALVVVSTFPVLMLYIFFQKYFVKGVMLGAIKG